MSTPPQSVYQSQLGSLTLVRRGKVRDIYRVDDAHLMIVATDRLSAFDVVLPTPIPGKGSVLTGLSRFWFDRTREIVANHLADVRLEDVIQDPTERAPLADRAMIVRDVQPLPVEAIVRGYLAGSGWKEYQAGGTVCGITLPEGLEQAQQLPEPIFTPSTKAEHGDHDENIDFERMRTLIDPAHADALRDISLRIYKDAAAYAAGRGIIIADTKLEFGLDASGSLVLIDEVLTPDSSRFWPADQHRLGTSPPSFDKQYVRDYLERLDWNKQPPGPELPSEVVKKTAEKYREAKRRLMS